MGRVRGGRKEKDPSMTRGKSCDLSEKGPERSCVENAKRGEERPEKDDREWSKKQKLMGNV